MIPTQLLRAHSSDPSIVPCRDLVYVGIWHHALVEGYESGGHNNPGWEMIETGL